LNQPVTHRSRQFEFSASVDAQGVVDIEGARYLAPSVRSGDEERCGGRVRSNAICGNYRDRLSMSNRVARARIEDVVKSRAFVIIEAFIVTGSKRCLTALKLDDTEKTGLAWMSNSDPPESLILPATGAPDYSKISAGIHKGVCDFPLE
jgi:hypothetical protein